MDKYKEKYFAFDELSLPEDFSDEERSYWLNIFCLVGQCNSEIEKSTWEFYIARNRAKRDVDIHDVTKSLLVANVHYAINDEVEFLTLPWLNDTLEDDMDAQLSIIRTIFKEFDTVHLENISTWKWSLKQLVGSFIYAVTWLHEQHMEIPFKVTFGKVIVLLYEMAMPETVLKANIEPISEFYSLIGHYYK